MEGVLFVSQKCQHSARLLREVPDMPPAISVIDVHDPRAHKFLVSYQIRGVPSLVIVTQDGKSAVVSARSEVSRVIEALRSRQQQPIHQQQNRQQPQPPPSKQQQLKETYRNREGIDADGPFPETSEEAGPRGFNDMGPLLDVGETYQAPFAPKHSMESSVMARTSADQRPQNMFQPPLPPQQPLLPAGQSGNAIQQNSSINNDEMSKKLDEMAQVRAEYDKTLEARNRAFNVQNMTMR